MNKIYNLKNDYNFNKYENYVHIYCKGCGHSMIFLTNHPTTCSYCGTLVYPSKRSEFKAKMKSMLRKEKENE